MNRYLYKLIVALFAISSLALTSCSSDDDDENSSNVELIGTWESYGGLNATYGIVQYIQFNPNGKYLEVTYDDDDGTDIIHGKWKREGNTVTVIGEEVSIPIQATIVSISKSDLVLNTLWEQAYKKVSDSEIEKYLK